MLEKVKALHLSKWAYKGTQEYHIGPVSEDFYRLFGLGVDDKSISTIDPSGIALAAIQAQQHIIEKLNQKLSEQEKSITELKSELKLLNEKINQLKSQ